MTAHSARAGRALRALTETDPAIAALSLWCAHRDREQPLTAATEGDTIHYGAAFYALPPHEQEGVAAHHVLHAALRHGARMRAMADRLGEGFEPRLWGIAADAIVNEALLLAGHALPRPALRLTGLLEAALGQMTDPAQALTEWDADRLYLRLAQGAGAGGSGEKALAHAAAQGHQQDLAPDPAASDRTEAEAEWRQHVARAVEAGRMAGTGVGPVLWRMAEIAAGGIAWEVVLRGLLMRALLPRAQETHRRPARSFLARDSEARRTGGPPPAFHPGFSRAAPAPRLVVGLDTSSSVTEAQMALFMAEVAGITRRVAAETWLLPFDDRPEAAIRMDPAGWRAQLEARPFRRGGGTDLVTALAAAVRLDPALIVMLTDLEGEAGAKPRLPVLWAVPDAAPTAPFGRVLSLAR